MDDGKRECYINHQDKTNRLEFNASQRFANFSTVKRREEEDIFHQLEGEGGGG